MLTIRGLKDAIATSEKEWEEKNMSEYMGSFDEQHVIVPKFEWNKPERYDPDGAFDFKGYTSDVNAYWDITGLGFIIEDAPTAIMDKNNES